MLGFSYEGFKKALYRVEEHDELKLQKDIENVKAFVEKCVAACLNSTANMARTTYSGIDM
ncbi:hypothetical protein KBA27_06525 [bacterium]|nr:hypothetical protein [bacterium]